MEMREHNVSIRLTFSSILGCWWEVIQGDLDERWSHFMEQVLKRVEQGPLRTGWEIVEDTVLEEYYVVWQGPINSERLRAWSAAAGIELGPMRWEKVVGDHGGWPRMRGYKRNQWVVSVWLDQPESLSAEEMWYWAAQYHGKSFDWGPDDG